MRCLSLCRSGGRLDYVVMMGMVLGSRRIDVRGVKKVGWMGKTWLGRFVVWFLFLLMSWISRES